MRITLVTVATAMVCLMGVHGDVQPQRDFDLQRFAGKWYRVGLAYDSPGFTAPYRDKLRVSMGILNPQTNGNVNLTMWTQRSSGCRSKLYTYEKTAIPGAFTYFSTRHNKVKDITVVETNYNEYALVLKHKKMDREYTQVALYGLEWGNMLIYQADRSRVNSKLDVYPCPEDVGKCLQNQPLGATVSAITMKSFSEGEA